MGALHSHSQERRAIKGEVLILITTTRRPSRRTRSFVRDLYHVLPKAERRNRGKMSLEDINELALQLGMERVLVVGTSRGNPSSLTFYEPNPVLIRPISIIRLRGVSLRREITSKRAPPSKDMCIVQSSRELGDLAQILSNSFKSRILQTSKEGLPHLYDECDLALYLFLGEGMIGSFYRTRPTWEVGPRMRIGGFESLEGEDRPELGSDFRAR